MPPSQSSWFASWSVRFLALAVIASAVYGASGFGVVLAQKERPAHTDEDRARDATNLKQAFAGLQIDLYFEMGELESSKPALSNVKFVDVVDVTGKELLRFEHSSESWLIDPDTVFAYKLHKSK